MRARRWLVAAVLVLAAAGCAQKTDWIEGTLVTVDVSGVWRGSGGLLRGVSGEIEMTLSQRGARVTGDGRFRANKMIIEGTVRGDVFSFADSDGRIRVNATVTGDEMTGVGWTRESPTWGDFRIKLSRQP